MTADTASRDAPPQSVKIIAPTRQTGDRVPRASRKRSLVKPLTEFFASIGATVYLVNTADGTVIVKGAERLAKSLDNLAKENATVYRNLERMLTGSAWGGVVIAAGAMALPILANHDLLPFHIPGVEAPESDPANIENMPINIPDIGPDRATG